MFLISCSFRTKLAKTKIIVDAPPSEWATWVRKIRKSRNFFNQLPVQHLVLASIGNGSTSYLKQLLAVDPGFSRGGECQPQMWGCQPIILGIFQKQTSWKWKNMDPKEDRSWETHLGPPMTCWMMFIWRIVCLFNWDVCWFTTFRLNVKFLYFNFVQRIPKWNLHVHETNKKRFLWQKTSGYGN